MPALAFVDVETTGLSPGEDRIREIGLVLVDEGRVRRWTTLLRSRSRDENATADTNPASPRFQDVACELAPMLANRLVVAHNARFDYGFLKTEFERVGIDFEPRLLCSLMLSRRLYPALDCHDLDALVRQHELDSTIRHRALPDADLLWQFWQVLGRSFPQPALDDAIEQLLAGPVLPEGLAPSLVERLPTLPGAYAFHGGDSEILLTGAATNLRSHVLNYFRLDQASGKALEYAHRITNISWRVTRGLLGAQLHAAAMDPVRRRPKPGAAQFCCRLVPDATPSVVVAPLRDCIDPSAGEAFGLFASERKAKNALTRLAFRDSLCHGMLGIDGYAAENCRACGADQGGRGCIGRANRAKQLARIFASLAEWDRPSWPYRGPIGIRERSDLHVIDRWQYLGTARDEADVDSLLDCRCDPDAFDQGVFALLQRALPNLSEAAIVRLARPRAK